MKHVLSIVLSSVFAASVAKAEAVYFVERGSWSIFNVADYCVAASRPTIETNFSPYMTLNLLYERESKEVSVAAYFWPNAFKKGEQILIGLRGLSDTEGVELPATATEHYAVRTDRALTREELRALRDKDALIVMAEGPPNQMAVQMDPDLRILVYDLQNCARFVEGK